MQIKKSIKKIIPKFLLDFYYWLWAFFGAIIFWFPSKKLTVIGVTGTSGKSTTVDFITKILEESGNNVASLSSIKFKIGDKEWNNELKMTMPGRFIIQKFLRQAIQANCKYAVLEVTSEGIKQYRHKFIAFNTVVFTNLSPEHIESHGGFENYRNEKLKLFKATPGTHVINIDDENAKYFLDILAKKIITFEIQDQKKHSDILQNIRMFAENVNGNSFTVNEVQFHLNVIGDFNVYNALAAISVALNYGVSLETCKKVLENIRGIPGRMEIVAKDPLVIVDYAHTPEQLKNVYKTLLNPKSQILNQKQIQNINIQNPKLICVLGSCGGGRDKWKRPVLGKIAGQYCKEIIITNEDPYDEDPLEIMEHVAGGIKSEVTTNSYHIVLDRKEAIKKAIGLAKPGDAVIITGKGSESLMCLANGKKIPWDDRQIVREELKNKLDINI